MVCPTCRTRSSRTETYDAIIIGTGQAGPFLAQRLAGAGMKVAIIERKLFGGTCVNTGWEGALTPEGLQQC
jgi:2-polyprenyl-6-methoxyphenol hydroxylase-like FAD-dependent oxidoreductase